jgi:CDP-glycerol glycerophosphotransferase (TagB/SpsB family)
MSVIKKIYTFLSILLAHLIHILAYLVPRSKKIWVCVGWHTGKEREIFADNSKYFFLYLQNEKPEITSVWIAKDKKLAKILQNKGYTAYYMHSFWGIYYALRAKYTIVDAWAQIENWKFSSGSMFVQLWHGKGMKKSGRVRHNPSQTHFKNPGFFLKYDFLFATSSNTAELLSLAFNKYPVEKIHITGHSRTDIFYKQIKGSEIDTNTKLSDCITKTKNENSQKIILYAPTFRADGSNPLDQFDFEKLNLFLKTHNYHFIIGLHPKFATKEIKNIDSYSHISNIPPGFDSYPSFKNIDLLITDYSNIYMDLLLLDTPIVFFTYDEEEYKKQTGLHKDFETLTPGPHVASFEELLETLAKTDNYKKEREQARNTLYAHQDGESSKRIFEKIKGN